MLGQFIKIVQNNIFQEKLLAQGDRVLIGVSGGADSIALALTFKKIQKKYNLKLLLVHINYGQRGCESDEDEKFVEKFASENDLELEIVTFDEILKGNLEEQLRDFRYQKFEEIRNELKFNKIAIAHHLDDQAETVLLNLIRGAGIDGLSGMKSRNDFVIRPFLEISREEVLKFLAENNQDYCFDKTNLKTDFTRNSIRLELIPFLEKQYNPNIKNSLRNLASNLQAENKINQIFIEKIYSDLTDKKEGRIILNIENLVIFPEEIWTKIFRKIVLELKGNLKNISKNHFQEFKKVLVSRKQKKQKITIDKIVLEKDKKYVIFSNA